MLQSSPIIGWGLQSTDDGNLTLPAALEFRSGEFLFISEALTEDRRVISQFEIQMLELAASRPNSDILSARLYRFGLIDRHGRITDEGETALAHLVFERSGVTRT